MNTNFIMLITYSFDTDYVSIPCEKEEEAYHWMDKLLREEIEIVEKEKEYTPKVLEIDEAEKILVYYDDDYTHYDDYYEHDYAMYKIIEVNHCYGIDGKEN